MLVTKGALSNFSLKCIKCLVVWLCRTRWGSLKHLPDPLAGFKGKGEARGRGEGGDRRGRGQKMEGKGRWGRERGERARKGETERRGEMGVGREIWPLLSFILVGAYRRKAAYPQDLSSPFPCTVRLYIKFYSYFLQTKSTKIWHFSSETPKQFRHRCYLGFVSLVHAELVTFVSDSWAFLYFTQKQLRYHHRVSLIGRAYTTWVFIGCWLRV